MQVIPAIDLKGGRCVRLLQGDFGQSTDYGNDPDAVAATYLATGFQRLHVVDLDGARAGLQCNRDAVLALVYGSGMQVQFGGGIRDSETVSFWLGTGVASVIIGSLAVDAKPTVRQWLDRYGGDRIILALDVRIDKSGLPRVATHGWTELSGETLWDCVDGYLDSGLRQVLCTDIGRDGALSGPNTGLYSEFIARYGSSVELQASGGVAGIRDLAVLRDIGVPSAITGRALLDGRIAPTELQQFLRGE